jgi:hypothetical protein
MMAQVAALHQILTIGEGATAAYPPHKGPSFTVSIGLADWIYASFKSGTDVFVVKSLSVLCRRTTVPQRSSL